MRATKSLITSHSSSFTEPDSSSTNAMLNASSVEHATYVGADDGAAVVGTGSVGSMMGVGSGSAVVS